MSQWSTIYLLYNVFEVLENAQGPPEVSTKNIAGDIFFHSTKRHRSCSPTKHYQQQQQQQQCILNMLNQDQAAD